MYIASNATSSSTKPTPSYLNRTPSLRNAEIRNESTRITIARTKQRSSCAHVAKAVRGHIHSLFTGGAPAAIAAGVGIFAGIHRPQLDSTHAFWKSRIYTLIIYIMHAASLDFNLSRSLHYPFAYNTYIHTDAIVSFCIFLSFFFLDCIRSSSAAGFAEPARTHASTAVSLISPGARARRYILWSYILVSH